MGEIARVRERERERERERLSGTAREEETFRFSRKQGPSGLHIRLPRTLRLIIGHVSFRLRGD